MKRPFVTAAIICLLAVSSVSASSCSSRAVAVKTGERVMCTYGEQVRTTVRTIRVSASKATQYSVKTTVITCDKHLKLESDYAAAQEALAKKDLKAATSALEKVLAVDAGYRLARQQLDDIKAGKTPSPDSSSASADTGTGTNGGGSSQPGQTTPGEDDPPQGPVASLLVYVPDKLSGYRAEQPIADAFAVSRQYLPSSAGRIVVTVIAAEQHRSAQAAIDWVKQNVRVLYPKSAQNVRIGSHDGYTGTDGRRFALVAWTEGPITVAIQAEVTKSPEDVQRDLQGIAAKIAR